MPSSQIRKQISFEISFLGDVKTDYYYYLTINTSGKAPTVPAYGSPLRTPTETTSLDYSKETYLADWTDYVLVHGNNVKLVNGPFDSTSSHKVQSENPELTIGTKSLKVTFYVDRLKNTDPSTLNFDFATVKDEIAYDKLDATYSTNMGRGTTTIVANESSTESFLSGNESLNISGGTVTVQ